MPWDSINRGAVVVIVGFGRTVIRNGWQYLRRTLFFAGPLYAMDGHSCDARWFLPGRGYAMDGRACDARWFLPGRYTR